jgi:anti-sigma28 factor (negative regulator of flagellin synthesis)
MNNPLGGVSSASGASFGSLETQNAVSHTSAASSATSKKAAQPVMGEAVPQAVSSDLAHLARLEGLRGQVQSGNYVADAKATATRWLATSAGMVAHKVK